MKKTIIIAIATIMMMTLVGCGEKGEPQVISHTIEEHFITENVIEEDTIEENLIREDIIVEGKYTLTEDELDSLIKAYQDGDVSEEYFEEVLFNSRIG